MEGDDSKQGGKTEIDELLLSYPLIHVADPGAVCCLLTAAGMHTRQHGAMATACVDY